jgi:hypothetical protein
MEIDLSNNNVDLSSNIIELIKTDISNNILETNLNRLEGLTSIQKKYILETFYVSKLAIDNIVNNKQLDNTILITTILVEIIKLVERINIGNHILLGIDKKKIAISIGSLYLQEKYPNNLEVTILYNAIAEQMLDQMVDLSKKINKLVKQKANLWCCFKQQHG